MRMLILAAAAAIVAAPAFAADESRVAGTAAQSDVTTPSAGDSTGMKMSNQSRHANPQPAEQAPQGDTTQDPKPK